MMRSRSASSHPRIVADFRPWVGITYEPPHGCFRLVEQVYRECYGIDLSGLDAGIEPWDKTSRLQRLHAELARLCIEVDSPQEGDVILMCRGGHIGLAIRPGVMLHSYRGGASCIEDYRDMRWRNRITGFYRYSP